MEYVISIDLGGTNLRIAIVSSDLEIVEVIRESTIKNDKDKLFEQICRMIDSLPYAKYKVKKVGMSACGLVDGDYITLLPNLKISDFDLKKRLEEKYPFKVNIRNDANCTALAEATFGSTKDVKDSYFITISTGIGGCLIHDSNMINLPFEIGHMMIHYKDGYQEFEKLCAGTGMENLARAYGLEVTGCKEFFDKVALNDKKALEVLDVWTTMVGTFIANTQMEFNVDKFCLSGGVMKSSAYFLKTLETKANEIVKNYPLKPVKIVLAEMDQDAGLFGGVAVALKIK
jgi:glucokinase